MAILENKMLARSLEKHSKQTKFLESRNKDLGFKTQLDTRDNKHADSLPLGHKQTMLDKVGIGII